MEIRNDKMKALNRKYGKKYMSRVSPAWIYHLHQKGKSIQEIKEKTTWLREDIEYVIKTMEKK